MRKRKLLNDKDVIINIKAGEIDDFIYIVKKYTPSIHRFIYVKIFNKHDVDDIVQNSFISFYRAISHFDPNKPVLPYLFEITRNELKMYYRSHKQTLPLKENIAAEEAMSDNWQYEISALLKKLPIVQQKALNLIAEGYSYQEIAKRLKKPLNTVRTIIRRARLKIIKLYK